MADSRVGVYFFISHLHFYSLGSDLGQALSMYAWLTEALDLILLPMWKAACFCCTVALLGSITLKNIIDGFQWDSIDERLGQF